MSSNGFFVNRRFQNMPDIQLPKLEVPSGSEKPTVKSAIFAMPEKFRGLTAKVQPPLVKIPTPNTSPVALPPPIKPQPIIKKTSKSSVTKTIIIAGVILFLVLGTAGTYVFFAFKPTENNKIEEVVSGNPNQVSKPTNQPANNPSVTEKPSTTPKTEVVSPFPNGTQPGRDTDSDGLTDVEEILFHTNAKMPDTDKDGFLDGNEVFHVYDPNIASPASLRDSSFMTLYTSENLSFLYPAVWTLKSEETSKNLVLVIPSGETVIIGFEEKDFSVSLADWFSGTSIEASETKVTAGKTKGGFLAMFTDDQMTAYVDLGTVVVTLNYQNTVKASIDYLQTFEMIINSLQMVTP